MGVALFVLIIALSTLAGILCVCVSIGHVKMAAYYGRTDILTAIMCGTFSLLMLVIGALMLFPIGYAIIYTSN